ncbi:nucleoporin Nup43-like isoform X1 [Mizuhopecten yessoensis]|uniref:Nucleoporin Nup43 n=1 Tax=Mizuhopecten yessoensis TaxID=6573 RepID=A0A210QAY4_MIZYE|nr:nucleoporin Nup43-like isoform X1 [Mizuhopecten yessoensis]OWF45896.1 Nucleoporin Nup43 [Mizuhopecten yessoensis]
MADTRATFVSHKINKIRWRQQQKQSLQESDVFASGSWDDEQNKVCLWKVERQKVQSGEMDDGGGKGYVESDPVTLCEAPHRGDVTGLEYMGQDHIVASSSTGTITIYKHHTNSQTLGVSQQWEKVHHHYGQMCPCTCLAVRDDVIVSSGEDGRVNIIQVGHKTPNRVIDKADSSTVNSITFLKQTEFVTVNSTGQLKIFDLRTNSDEPTQTLSVTGELTPLQCIDKHPSQAHIVATGGQDGVLGMWDLRHDKFPVSLMEAHSGTVWEVRFHPTAPDHLFTCSEDGCVWHWDGSQVNATPVGMVTGINQITGTGAGSGGGNLSTPRQFQYGGSAVATGLTNPWLATDIAKNKIEITSLLDQKSLPINTLDVAGHTLLCGTDGETIFTMNLGSLR